MKKCTMLYIYFFSLTNIIHADWRLWALRGVGTVSNARLWPLWRTMMMLWWCGLRVGVGVGLGRVGRGFRGAAAWWCGTGGDWAPQRAQLDEATAPNGCARFWAAGPEPVRLLPRSVEEGKNRTALIFRREQNDRDIYILWANELYTLIHIMLTYK